MWPSAPASELPNPWHTRELEAQGGEWAAEATRRQTLSAAVRNLPSFARRVIDERLSSWQANRVGPGPRAS